MYTLTAVAREGRSGTFVYAKAGVVALRAVVGHIARVRPQPDAVAQAARSACGWAASHPSSAKVLALECAVEQRLEIREGNW
jgi:hypothetical protein